MRLKWVRDACGTCLGCARDVCEMCPKRAQDMSMQAQNLAIKLQQDVCEHHAPFSPDRNAFRMRAGCVWNVQVPDVCEAELYR